MSVKKTSFTACKLKKALLTTLIQTLVIQFSSIHSENFFNFFFKGLQHITCNLVGPIFKNVMLKTCWLIVSVVYFKQLFNTSD
ncbi:hypothetical protein N779_00850 [Vibrio coralliilyticus OCN008]|nr:hypothetical protein N779_00850 [Vibrio coralliilyticus OCN008]